MIWQPSARGGLLPVVFLAVSMSAWGPAAMAARQDPAADAPTRIRLDAVVTQTAGDSEDTENPERRTWRITTLTTSGRLFEVRHEASTLTATPSLLADGRIAVEASIRVFLSSPSPEPGAVPPRMVVDANAVQVILEDGEATTVLALTDDAGGTVEVTLTAAALGESGG